MQFFKREIISRHDKELYLERLIIFKCAWFGIMLHKFYASDDDCMHDHPWPFVSIILRGGYWEWTRGGDVLMSDRDGSSGDRRDWYRPGSILFRGARHLHRIQLALDGRPTWSLVFTGPRVRDWGFITPKGWIVHWRYNYAKHCG